MEIVDFLQNYINKKNICFTKGAFVFEDPKQELFDKLRRKKGVYKRISSHEKYFKTSERIQAYGLDVKSKIKCPNEIRNVGTILFFNYNLKNKDTKFNKSFTYVKLEGHGMKQFKNIIAHSLSYIKTRFDNSSKKRSEHTKIANKAPYKIPEKATIICKNIPECTTKKQLEYTKYFRRGFEVYIPKSHYKKELLDK